MITVGRTQNNDVVLPDVSISRFHAWFRVDPAGVELTDAGSRNGTFVGERELGKNGPPVRLASGDEVRFGSKAFQFFSPGDAWERLRK